VVLNARVIGGIQMIDNGEADDKIIAVLANDSFWDSAQDIENLPPVLVERLRHYFGTYKLTPGKENVTFIAGTYNRQAAYTVVEAAIADYEEAFGS